MRILLPLVIAAGLAAASAAAETVVPRAAEPVDEGFSLIEEGAKLILREMMDDMKPALDEAQRGLGQALAEWEPALRDLAGKVGDLSAYHAPEVLPNGDIIIRRKQAFGPEMPGTKLGPNGEIDL